MSGSASIKLGRNHRTSTFLRQSSQPGFYTAKHTPPLDRSFSKASLFGASDRVCSFFNKDMFNVLFSLAKDSNSNGTPISASAGSSRDALINAVYKLHRTRARIFEPYKRLKNALKQMQNEYLESKEHNILTRYSKMQKMIHEVVLLEKQYWQLLTIPGQETSENQNDYVLRVMNLLEERGPAYPAKSGGIASLLSATLNMAERTKDQNTFEFIRCKTTDQLRRECDLLYLEVYKLIRKYLNLRSVVQNLTEKYQSSRFYPIIPRYILLKNFIKEALRNEAFAEICHTDE